MVPEWHWQAAQEVMIAVAWVSIQPMEEVSGFSVIIYNNVLLFFCKTPDSRQGDQATIWSYTRRRAIAGFILRLQLP